MENKNGTKEQTCIHKKSRTNEKKKRSKQKAYHSGNMRVVPQEKSPLGHLKKINLNADFNYNLSKYITPRNRRERSATNKEQKS
jgi:hypothetical protein